MSEERLPEKVEKELLDIVSKSNNGISDFSYTISPDGKQIRLTGHMLTPDFQNMYTYVEFIEDLLDVNFIYVSNENGLHTFTYEFNK